MFKAPKIIYGGNFKPPLEGVGNFKDPEQSMFTKTPPKKLKEEQLIDDEPSSPGKASSPQKPQGAATTKSAEGSEGGEQDPPVRTATVKTGRIQFAGIVLPPEAPTDLICEECERENAIYYCGACAEVFCFKCCDLCHPRISANDLMHQHEKDGRIRGLIFGDKSRINKRIVDDTFYLPDHLFYFDEYNKIKDLMKPNSLTTSEDARQKDAQSIVNKENSANLIKQMKPKFEVKQMVLFTDPATEKPAYGSIISEWDYMHGQSAPAIIRGDEAPVYYYVQILGQLVNVENLESLLPPEKVTEVDRKKKSSIYNPKERIAKELEDAPLRKEYDLGKQLTRRIKELNNLLVLGPKYHFRDITENNGKLGYAEKLESMKHHGGYDDNSSTTQSGTGGTSTTGDSTTEDSESFVSLHSAASLPVAMARRRQGLPPSAIMGSNGLKLVAPLPRAGGGGGHRHHQNIAQQGWDAKKLQEFQSKITSNDLKQEIEERKKRSATEANENTEQGEVYNVNGKNAKPIRMFGLSLGVGGSEVVEEEDVDDNGDGRRIRKNIFQRKTAEEVIDSIDYRPVENKFYENLDLSLYADVEIDDQSMLSHFNANQRPLPAHMRSYQHLVKDKVTVSQSNRVLDSLKEVLHKKEDVFNIPTLSTQTQGQSSSVASYPGSSNYTIKENVDVQKEMLNIIVLPETSIESMKERVEFYKARQKMLLEQAMNKNDFIWLRVQMKLKFNIWKRSLGELKEKKKDYCARKIQTRARVWLCRNKLQECRDWWDGYYKAKREAVHSRFRYAKATDKYAVTMDNKIYFRTLADMNRYAYFLRVCATKIFRHFERRRMVLMKQAIVRWKDAIYEFLEKSLQNEHIQKHLFSKDDLDVYEDDEALKRLAKDDVFKAKEEILERHEHLLAYISPLYQSVIKKYSKDKKNKKGDKESKVSSSASPTKLVSGGIAFDESEKGMSEGKGEKGEDGDVTKRSISSSSTAERYYFSDFYDEFGYETISSIPLRIQSVTKVNPYTPKQEDGNDEKEDDESDAGILMPLNSSKSRTTASTSAKTFGSGRGEPMEPIRLEEDGHVPAYDPSRISALPPLLKLGRPKTFRDRLYHDLQQDLHLLPAEMRKEYRTLLTAQFGSTGEGEGEEIIKNIDGFGGDHDTTADEDTATVTSAITADTGTAGTATGTAVSALTLPKTMKTPLSTYKSLMTGPTNQSYWIIPEILMTGNAPLGNANHFDFNIYDPIFNTSLVECESVLFEKEAETKSQNANVATTAIKKTELSCITALLLVGVNVFISVMTEEEENALLYFYDQTEAMKNKGTDVDGKTASIKATLTTPAVGNEGGGEGKTAKEEESSQPTKVEGKQKYAVKSMQRRLNEELKAARKTAIRMIGDYSEIIRKQQINLGKIPRFGRTDPRYPAAHREITRCEARISLARSNIVKIRQQIKHLPKTVTYLRLPISEYAFPWNREMVLPTLWMLEYLVHHRDEKISSNVVCHDIDINSKDEEELEDPSKILSQLAESNPIIDEKLDRNPNKVFRDSPNVFFETKIAEKPQTNVYYVYGGGPFHLTEDGLSKDGRAGLLTAMALGRLYRLDPLEVIYRWQRAHDAMGIYSFSTLPKKTFHLVNGKDPLNKQYNNYKTPVPPLPWMRSLLIDVMQFSHRPLEPLHYRMRYDPDTHKSAYEDKNYHPVDDETGNNSKLKINNLNYNNKSLYDEDDDMAALAAFNKGVNIRGGPASQQSSSVAPPVATTTHQNKGDVNILGKAKIETYDDDENSLDSSKPEDASAIMKRIMMEKEYADDFQERTRTKQSLYFEHYL